eukprot:TRINITY_DN1813_c0_g1_i1.p2 TRINITY_DN1813_c0_g1~~TRINITY_DN1813_c0_g1_i1.p2  ORF type:complete len:128 (-),score=33.27 TRINITY_DN1813_c0_g1_i1:1332-1715(-)
MLNACLSNCAVCDVLACSRDRSIRSVQKALRMVDPTAVQGFQPRKARTRAQMERELGRPTDLRMFAIAQALYEGSMTVDEVHNFSKIDRWFLRRLERIAKHSREVLSGSSLEAMTEEVWRRKQLNLG